MPRGPPTASTRATTESSTPPTLDQVAGLVDERRGGGGVAAGERGSGQHEQQIDSSIISGRGVSEPVEQRPADHGG